MKIEAPKKDARSYMPWAGFFSHPDTDPEAFRSLPGWRQREILFSITERKAGRTVMVDDLLKLRQGSTDAPVRMTIPGGWSLDCLRRIATPLDPAPEFLPPVDQLLADRFSTENLARECTMFGEGLRLRYTIPLDGLMAYAWIVLAVKRELIPALPVSALIELEEGLYMHTGQKVNLRSKSSGGAHILQRADDLLSAFLPSLA